MEKKINLPMTDKDIRSLKVGDKVLLTGTLYTARDAAHKRLVNDLAPRLKSRITDTSVSGPLILKDQIIYYCGPTPAMPGRVIGSAGPTTSSRMDSFTLPLLKAGIKGMIGKGSRSKEIHEMIKKYNGTITFKHVRAHTNGSDFESRCNQLADELAVTGSNSSTKKS